MNEKRRASLLLDEPPILVYPTLAKALGINKAVIMQQIHFLLNAARTANHHYNFVDGRWWVYNSYAEWVDRYFPWLSPGGLKRMLLELEKEHYLLSRQSVKVKSDRRKWYTIHYDVWEQFVLTIGAKCSDEPSAQNVPMVGAKCSDDSSETPSETPKTPEGISPAGESAPQKQPRKPHKNAPWHDSLVAAFGLKAETLTATSDRLYWKVAAELSAIQFPVESIPALYGYVKARSLREKWNSFSVNALAKYAPDFLKANPSTNADSYKPVYTLSPEDAREADAEGRRLLAEAKRRALEAKGLPVS